MATNPDKPLSATYKTLLLGGALGYLLAVATSSGSTAAITAQHVFSRALVEEGDMELEMGGEDSAQEEEEEIDPVTMDSTVTFIVLVLIILTIAFETIKETIEEGADRNMRPIIASLFGEMTVLGFLSIFTFCVTKMGFFENLSVHLFGEQEEEALLEIFEFVHYMLFLIMVFFVITVLALVAGAQNMEKKWWLMNRACHHEEYLAKLDELELSDGRPAPTSWLSYLFQTLIPCSVNDKLEYRADLRLFRGLRNEFILERSFEPPFSPHKTNRVENDFDYGRYLGIAHGHELAHVVHLGHTTWFFFALLTVFFYAVSMAVANRLTTFAWVWAATGWVLFLFGNYFDFHMKNLITSLATPSTLHAEGASETGSLLQNPLPGWTSIDFAEFVTNRSAFTKWYVGSSTVTRQDALYWMERKGPKIYMTIFQIQLVFTSAYISLLLLAFIEHIYEYCTLPETVAYIIVSVLPICYLVTKYQKSAATMTIACSFGVHRRPQAVSQVIRDGKIDRIIRAMVVMHKLEQGATHGFEESHHGSTTFDALELEQVAKSFDALDVSGDGKIENSELQSVLSALGAPTSASAIDEILKVLDRNGDGHVTKDEFVEFYSNHVLAAVHEHGLHDLAHALYHQFDRDDSGQITLGEFKEVMDAFNVGFTVNEIGHLVNELDEQDNGMVGEHEFFALLEKHNHLFESHPLPKLE